MKWIPYTIILLSLTLFGCSEKDQANDHAVSQTYELRISKTSKSNTENTNGIIHHVDLFTEGDRTVRVDRGQDGHTQVSVSGGSSGGSIPGTVQIILTAKLKSDGGSSIFEKQSEMRTKSGGAGGPSSGTVDPNLKFSDLASFVVKPGKYAYGEEVLLGTVEGDKWILTVK
jgi:hypothetical protein